MALPSVALLRPKKISLTVRISVVLVLAVVLPLLITGIGSELILRPTLLSQASTEMGNDAQKHTQAIDSLLIAHLQDLQFLGKFLATQKFLAGDDVFKQQALNELTLGYHLDANYSMWTLFNTNGKMLLSSPAAPTLRGKYAIPPEIMKQVRGPNKTLISDVYFDNTAHMAFIDMYTSVTSANGKFLGIERSTLKMTEIWTEINNETNATAGSFAMILDGHGVRIAYTNPDTTLTTFPPELFTSAAPLSQQFQQQVHDENIYGTTFVKELSDPTLVDQLQNPNGSPTFQFVPALQTESFQTYRATLQVVPWSYLVLRPVNTITNAANRQDIYLVLLAALVTLLAAIIGLVIGRSIARPILRSVSLLINSSTSLKTLAAREQSTAKEQKWIVDSARKGVEAMQYYAKASKIAANKLDSIGKDLTQNHERIDPFRMRQRLAEIVATAGYIENAANFQEHSSRDVSTAVRITTQVTEQLLVGATSASDAALQLEEVIKQLREVVGE
ncbi:MAG: methyl-accepting chemotaxis protein [Ktedonobacteraceae bacterium]|nr:methyl-accepting chemotaxis protein [Ktedonobacteraceae bacterium]